MKQYYLIALLAFAALITSVLVEVQLENTSTCPIGGCSSVQTSQYGKILGVNNALYGMFGFALLTMLALMQAKEPNKTRKHVLFAGCTLAGLMALWFIFVQAFILNAFCVYCLIADGIALSVFILALVYWRR